jgi:hypothetical protein
VTTGGGAAAGGHAKLGDFGAVRPQVGEAGEAARAYCAASRSLVTQLRDGDWRVKAGLPPTAAAASIENDPQELLEQVPMTPMCEQDCWPQPHTARIEPPPCRGD